MVNGSLFNMDYLTFAKFYTIGLKHIYSLSDDQMYEYYIEYGNAFLYHCTDDALEEVFNCIGYRMMPFDTDVVSLRLTGLKYGVYSARFNRHLLVPQLQRGYPMIVECVDDLEWVCNNYPHLVRYLDIRCDKTPRATALSSKIIFHITDVKFEF